MSTDFEQIALSRSEFALLEQLAKDNLYQKPEMDDAVRRLERLEFVESRKAIWELDKFDENCKRPDGSIRAVFITETGRDYYEYVKFRKSAERSSRAHDLFVAVIGAVAGCVVTLAIQAIIALLL